MTDHQTNLRDAMLALPRRERDTIDPEKIAQDLDDGLGMLTSSGYVAEEAAKANSMDSAMSLALRTHIAYADAADKLGEVAAAVAKQHAHAKALAADAKAALRRAQIGTDTKKVQTAAHEATLTKAGQSLEVHDEAKVPGKFFELVPQRQDAKIKAALVLGEDVPGARLVEGDPGIRVAARK